MPRFPRLSWELGGVVVAQFQPGQDVTVEVHRGGETKEIAIDGTMSLQDLRQAINDVSRITEIDLGRKVKYEVQMRLEQRGIKVTIVDKTIGYELRSTQIAVADELAGAAELVMGKADGVPAAVIRGVDVRGDADVADPTQAGAALICGWGHERGGL